MFDVLTNMPPVGGASPGLRGRNRSSWQGDTGYDSEPGSGSCCGGWASLRSWANGDGNMAVAWGYTAGSWNWTIAWLHSFGRLRRRLDRGTELQDAFLQLACGLICLRFVVDT